MDFIEDYGDIRHKHSHIHSKPEKHQQTINTALKDWCLEIFEEEGEEKEEEIVEKEEESEGEDSDSEIFAKLKTNIKVKETIKEEKKVNKFRYKGK